ncbi:notchless protein homolog 1-like [Dysidea avara]|uniref:notchless protein homolog 1-like n=1 Tax=Dysidea avara TaxID=196820 RepID=UPI0033179FC6
MLVKVSEMLCNELNIADNEARETLEQLEDVQTEKLVEIQYQPRARFKAQAVTRCTSNVPGHSEAVIAVSFSPDGRCLASGSGDCTVRLWDTNTETPHHVCKAHSHWILSIAWSPDGKKIASGCKAGKEVISEELLVLGCDDFTLLLWQSSTSKKPLARMTGHQQLINQVSFSPDAGLIASTSFDKSVKLWDGRMGKYITSLRGHVSAVYQISWSADSRLLCSGSSDSTLKVWDIKNRKLLMDLPGHVDEVFSVDWSTNGEQVASGGRDRHIEIWKR